MSSFYGYVDGLILCICLNPTFIYDCPTSECVVTVADELSTHVLPSASAILGIDADILCHRGSHLLSCRRVVPSSILQEQRGVASRRAIGSCQFGGRRGERRDLSASTALIVHIYMCVYVCGMSTSTCYQVLCGLVTEGTTDVRRSISLRDEK